FRSYATDPLLLHANKTAGLVHALLNGGLSTFIAHPGHLRIQCPMFAGAVREDSLAVVPFSSTAPQKRSLQHPRDSEWLKTRRFRLLHIAPECTPDLRSPRAH